MSLPNNISSIKGRSMNPKLTALIVVAVLLLVTFAVYLIVFGSSSLGNKTVSKGDKEHSATLRLESKADVSEGSSAEVASKGNTSPREVKSIHLLVGEDEDDPKKTSLDPEEVQRREAIWKKREEVQAKGDDPREEWEQLWRAFNEAQWEQERQQREQEEIMIRIETEERQRLKEEQKARQLLEELIRADEEDWKERQLEQERAKLKHARKERRYHHSRHIGNCWRSPNISSNRTSWGSDLPIPPPNSPRSPTPPHSPDFGSDPRFKHHHHTCR